MGSIPVRTTRDPVFSKKNTHRSYSVVVSTTDFESVNLGSSPSKSLNRLLTAILNKTIPF